MNEWINAGKKNPSISTACGFWKKVDKSSKMHYKFGISFESFIQTVCNPIPKYNIYLPVCNNWAFLLKVLPRQSAMQYLSTVVIT